MWAPSGTSALNRIGSGEAVVVQIISASATASATVATAEPPTSSASAAAFVGLRPQIVIRSIGRT